MKNFEYRARAREALGGQWGMNALIIFLIMMVSESIVSIVSSFTNFPEDSYRQSMMTFFLGILILFAFEYAQNYIALSVIRGKRAALNDTFVIFQKDYYIPMAIINFINTIISTLLGLIVYVPVLLVVGIGAYTAAVSGRTLNLQTASEITSHSPVSIVVLILVLAGTMLVYMLVNAILSGVFQFAVWVKLDHPELSARKCIKAGWFLIKDRMGQFIVLNLSFMGWIILGALVFVIPLFFVFAYVNVTMAGFYDEALKEKGLPEF